MFNISCFCLNHVFICSWAVGLGVNVWTSFIAGPVMFRKLNRHTFLEVQSNLFPAYFLLQVAASTLQLLIILGANQPSLSPLSGFEANVATGAAVSVCACLANWLYVGPVTTKLFLKKRMLEREEGVMWPDVGDKLAHSDEYKRLKRRGGMYHGVSMLLNLLTLAASLYTLHFLSSAVFGAARVGAADVGKAE